MQHIWKALKAHWKAAIDKNDKSLPVTNLGNAGEYGDLWRFQELIWRSDEDTQE